VSVFALMQLQRALRLTRARGSVRLHAVRA
jgi:hypothetical protein